MDAKTILIVAGLVLALYLGGCFPTANAQTPQGNPTRTQQQAPQAQMDPAECYDQVHAAVRDQWAQMSKLQRFTIGMKAISLCEGGTK